jgi:hypothetical protein
MTNIPLHRNFVSRFLNFFRKARPKWVKDIFEQIKNKNKSAVLGVFEIQSNI